MAKSSHCKDLFEPIEHGGVKPNNSSQEEWRKLNRKTIGHLRQWLDDIVFFHVYNETSAHSL